MPLFELIWWFLKTQLKLIPKVYKKTEFYLHSSLDFFLQCFTTYFGLPNYVILYLFGKNVFFRFTRFLLYFHDFLEIQWFFPKYFSMNMHILVALFKMTLIVPLDHEKRPRNNRQQLDFHHKCMHSPNKSLFYHYYVSYNK